MKDVDSLRNDLVNYMLNGLSCFYSSTVVISNMPTNR